MAAMLAVYSAGLKAALMDVPWVVGKGASTAVRMAARSVAWWAASTDVSSVALKDVMMVVC